MSLGNVTIVNSTANITDSEIESLKKCKSEREWNAACDAIKATRGGLYPADWWPKVQMSGLMREVAAGFGGDTSIKISAL